MNPIGNDPERIALVGHSFGGFIAAITASEQSAADCLAYLAGADFGAFAQMAANDPELRGVFVDALGVDMDEDGGPIQGDPEAMAPRSSTDSKPTASWLERPPWRTSPYSWWAVLGT